MGRHIIYSFINAATKNLHFGLINSFVGLVNCKLTIRKWPILQMYRILQSYVPCSAWSQCPEVEASRITEERHLHLDFLDLLLCRE